MVFFRKTLLLLLGLIRAGLRFSFWLEKTETATQISCKLDWFYVNYDSGSSCDMKILG